MRVEFAGCHVPDDPGHRRARQRSLAGDAKGPAPVEAGDNQQVITVKWKLYTRDEDRRPPVVGPEIKQHDLKTDALARRGVAADVRPDQAAPHQGPLHRRIER